MGNILSTPITIFGQDFTDPSFVKQQYIVPLTTAVPMILLEKYLWDAEWQKKFSMPKNKSLYFSAVRSNLRNYGSATSRIQQTRYKLSTCFVMLAYMEL